MGAEGWISAGVRGAGGGGGGGMEPWNHKATRAMPYSFVRNYEEEKYVARPSGRECSARRLCEVLMKRRAGSLDHRHTALTAKSAVSIDEVAVDVSLDGQRVRIVVRPGKRHHHMCPGRLLLRLTTTSQSQ